MYYYVLLFLLLCFLLKFFSKPKRKLKMQCLAFDLLELQHNINRSPRNLNGFNMVDKAH